MKKILSLALALTMMTSIALTGCGSSGSSSSGEGETTESDLAYVQDKGTLVVGITDFEPMDYKDESGDWVGFDADMATLFAESLGVEVEFVEIDWDNKILELDNKSVDCIWNGMTLTEEVTSAMDCSYAYCNNSQIVIVPADKADDYQDIDSLSELNFAVESGSAGQQAAESNNLTFTEVTSQAAALMEVSSGNSDAAIIDSLMADAMVGEGTSYESLAHTVRLGDEKYGVGFRKESDLVSMLNDFLKASFLDGTSADVAGKYGITAALVEPKAD